MTLIQTIQFAIGSLARHGLNTQSAMLTVLLSDYQNGEISEYYLRQAANLYLLQLA